MGIEINQGAGTGQMVTVQVKKWLTADKDRLVDDGDPAADTLYCTPGMQIPREDAEKFGLLDGGTPAPGEEADTDDASPAGLEDQGPDEEQKGVPAPGEEAAKSRPPAANKARGAAANKGAAADKGDKA